MTKSKSDGYYVQLIERKNGKIIKNEQYVLEEYAHEIFPINEFVSFEKEVKGSLKWYDRLFNTNRNKVYKKAKYYAEITAIAFEEVVTDSIRLIKKDND